MSSEAYLVNGSLGNRDEYASPSSVQRKVLAYSWLAFY